VSTVWKQQPQSKSEELSATVWKENLRKKRNQKNIMLEKYCFPRMKSITHIQKKYNNTFATADAVL